MTARPELLALKDRHTDQPVADAGLGNDVLGLRRVLFEFLPKVSHVYSQIAKVGNVRRTPYFLKQLLSCDLGRPPQVCRRKCARIRAITSGSPNSLVR